MRVLLPVRYQAGKRSVRKILRMREYVRLDSVQRPCWTMGQAIQNPGDPLPRALCFPRRMFKHPPCMLTLQPNRGDCAVAVLMTHDCQLELVEQFKCARMHELSPFE